MNSSESKTPPIQPPVTPSSTSSFSTYSLFDSNTAPHLFTEYSDYGLFPKHSIQGEADFNQDALYSTTDPTFFATKQSSLSHSKCCLNRSLIRCGQQLSCQSCKRVEYIKTAVQYKEYQSLNALQPHYPCAKLKNIPWDASQSDIRHFLGHCQFPSPSHYAQSIHILMDRTTGKTLSDAYVEFANTSELWHAIETRHEKPLKGRLITITECSQDEFLSVVFPKWRGQFQNNLAIPPTMDIVKTMSTAAGGGSHSTCPPFVTREEINSLLVVCKNYKLHFSRKCAERPFENIITVIAKYPWHQPHLITTTHRDHIFELLKLSIESLKIHLTKDYIHIEPTLLERLVFSGIMCPAFTEHQKTTLLHISRIDCPRHIASFLYPMEPIYSAYHNRESPDSSISSLMLEIEQDCLLDPLKKSTKKGPIPLLLHPSESKLSPWAPAYSPSINELWKTPSPPVLESNKSVHSKALAA